MSSAEKESAQPEFEIYVLKRKGPNHEPGQEESPHIVSLTPINRGGYRYEEEQVLSLIVPALQSAVIQAVQDYLPNMSLESISHISGILQMNNINDYRHTHTENVKLGEISLSQIQDIFDRVAGYGEIGLFDVSFSYLISPLSLQEGAGKSKTKKTQGIYPKTLSTPSYKGSIVGCAASSIVFYLAKSGYYGNSLQGNISRKQGEKQWFEKAKELQSQLCWNDKILVLKSSSL